MGTRADFYIGKNKDAEWIGSIAWDGYREGIDKQILNCQSPDAFRHAVESFLTERDDGIFPKDGWPWPWDNSATTDCSYWFFDGQVWDEYEDQYRSCSGPELEDIEYPDFSEQFNGGSAGFLILHPVHSGQGEK